MLDNLHFTKELGYQSLTALETGNLDEFARLIKAGIHRGFHLSGWWDEAFPLHAFDVIAHDKAVGVDAADAEGLLVAGHDDGFSGDDLEGDGFACCGDFSHGCGIDFDATAARRLLAHSWGHAIYVAAEGYEGEWRTRMFAPDLGVTEDPATGSAAAGTDFTALSAGTFTVPAGDTTASFNVSVTGESLMNCRFAVCPMTRRMMSCVSSQASSPPSATRPSRRRTTANCSTPCSVICAAPPLPPTPGGLRPAW